MVPSKKKPSIFHCEGDRMELEVTGHQWRYLQGAPLDKRQLNSTREKEDEYKSRQHKIAGES